MIHEKAGNTLEDLIEEQWKPVLVAYWYKRLEQLEIDFRQTNSVIKGCEDWNDGRCPLLLFIQPVLGMVLIFKVAVPYLVWSDLVTKTVSTNNARLYRQGQKDTVIVATSSLKTP